MKMRTIILPLLLSVAAAAPAAAYSYGSPQPVESWQLNKFIGMNLHGRAYANLGVVSAANRNMGTIALVGRHGELATIHRSMLVRSGYQLRAPDLTYGDIARVSNGGMSRVPIVRGEIFIEEPAPVYPPYDSGE
jgi:hypothetical protein